MNTTRKLSRSQDKNPKMSNDRRDFEFLRACQ